MKNKQIFLKWIFLLFLMSSTCSLLAQHGDKNPQKKKQNDTTKVEVNQNASNNESVADQMNTVPCIPDTALIHILRDSILRMGNQLTVIQNSLDEQIKKTDSLQKANDTLQDRMKETARFYILVGIEMLKLKCNDAQCEFVSKCVYDFLSAIPENLKQEYTEWMFTDIDKMIGASNAPEDIRLKVRNLLHQLPQNVIDNQVKSDIKVVINGVPTDYPQYDPAPYLIQKLESIRDTTSNKDYTAVIRLEIQLLKEYKDANNEVREVLDAIHKDPNNRAGLDESSRSTFIKKIKNTNYYKKYHKNDCWEPWNIFYLSNIIDEALKRLSNKDLKRVDFQDLINKL